MVRSNLFFLGELYIKNLVLIIRVKRCPPKTINTITVSLPLNTVEHIAYPARDFEINIYLDHDHDHDHDHDSHDEMPELENQGKFIFSE